MRHWLRRRRKPAMILSAIPILLVLYWLVGGQQLFPLPTGPKQPIDFKHSVMVKEIGIDCYYCHPYPGVSSNAGMPSVDKCLLCHDVIPVDATPRMREYQRRGEGIPWVRVTWIPSYVRFNHECHIAGGHKCSDCHGDVASMDRVRMVKDMDMSFCVNCHKQNGVSRDCFLCHY